MNRLLTFAFALTTVVGCAKSAPDAAAADKSADKANTMPSDKKSDDGPKPGDIPAPSDVAAPPADAQKTESGLAYKVLSKGAGTESPSATDRVQVHYTGWQTDGKMFDSSVKRGTPATFPLNGVIKGWTEGVQLMKEGDKFRFWIPADAAYGDPPKRPGAPAGMLVFDIELLSIDKPLPAPADVAAAPADAKKTASGLAYKVLTPGTGKVKPTAEDTVEVHYTGWETNGRMFDSSVKRGQTTSFPLNRVIKGWTEGVQLMVVGEKTRFWIPADLAYGEQAQGGRPSGLLVFDIELVSIQGK
jgi:FKBP-type peptidyl-prolyl cis-trans isomerase